jgi:hypothetical protein
MAGSLWWPMMPAWKTYMTAKHTTQPHGNHQATNFEQENFHQFFEADDVQQYLHCQSQSGSTSIQQPTLMYGGDTLLNFLTELETSHCGLSQSFWIELEMPSNRDTTLFHNISHHTMRMLDQKN